MQTQVLCWQRGGISLYNRAALDIPNHCTLWMSQQEGRQSASLSKTYAHLEHAEVQTQLSLRLNRDQMDYGSHPDQQIQQEICTSTLKSTGLMETGVAKSCDLDYVRAKYCTNAANALVCSSWLKPITYFFKTCVSLLLNLTIKSTLSGSIVVWWWAWWWALQLEGIEGLSVQREKETKNCPLVWLSTSKHECILLGFHATAWHKVTHNFKVDWKKKILKSVKSIQLCTSRDGNFCPFFFAK